jgi:hypothetical protein
VLRAHRNGAHVAATRCLLARRPPFSSSPTAATESTKASHLQQCDRTARQKVLI